MVVLDLPLKVDYQPITLKSTSPLKLKSKANLFYTSWITPKSVISLRGHLRVIAHSFFRRNVAAVWWRAICVQFGRPEIRIADLLLQRQTLYLTARPIGRLLCFKNGQVTIKLEVPDHHKIRDSVSHTNWLKFKSVFLLIVTQYVTNLGNT